MLGTLRILHACRGRSRWPAAALRALQEQQLRAVVAHAYARVPFHRRRLEAARLTPTAVRTLDDLRRLPTTSKQLLRSTPAAELITRGTDPAGCDVVCTSGSTGMPLRILRGRREVDCHRAAGLRILRELGFRWTDRTLEIRAVSGPTFAAQRLGVAPKRWVSILDSPAEQLRALVDFRPQVICAAASTLRDLAVAVLEAGVAPPPLRLIIQDAEPLLPSTRALVARAFGVVPLDVYGLVELSNFAWECEQRAGLHVSADTHLVEILGDDDMPLPPRTPGRIVCTDLLARTMPMLRYETGDWGALATDPCPCGRTFPRIVDLVGREGDVVLLPSGRRLHWPYFHETFARYDELDRYQVIQEELDRVRVRILARPERYQALVDRLAAELGTVIPPAVRVEFEPWNAAPPDPTQKYRPVLTKVRSH
ncbi:MAG: phenylacetate--CoA ligase family protein [Deltaproteobacteria bacterium]|nr:phenylacetate--CoA ligase family protein [Deltaproteobacteria bacterium]